MANGHRNTWPGSTGVAGGTQVREVQETDVPSCVLSGMWAACVDWTQEFFTCRLGSAPGECLPTLATTSESSILKARLSDTVLWSWYTAMGQWHHPKLDPQKLTDTSF